MPLQGPPTVPPSRTPRPAAIGCPPEYVFPPRQRSPAHESVGERFVGDANLKKRGLGVGGRRRAVQFAPTRLTESIRHDDETPVRIHPRGLVFVRRQEEPDQ